MTLHNIHVTNIPYSFKLSLGYIIRSKTIDIFQTETKVYKASAYKLWSLYSYNLKLLHDTNNLLAIPIARFSSINKTLRTQIGHKRYIFIFSKFIFYINISYTFNISIFEGQIGYTEYVFSYWYYPLPFLHEKIF